MSRREPQRRRLTDRWIRTLPAPKVKAIHWDTVQGGLGLQVTPTGRKSFKVVYRHAGRLRWFHIDSYPAIGLAEARDIARKVRAKAALGADPQGEKREARKGDTFADLARRFIDEYARERNRAWRQTDYLLQRHAVAAWGVRKAKTITRDDVQRLFDNITKDAPILANQALAAVSRLFSWAIGKPDVDLAVNPCSGISRNPTNERDRVLTEEEIRKVWVAFDEFGLVVGSALKVQLLTAQRFGEIRKMRRQDIDGRWWTLPREFSKNKQSHRVYLTDDVMDIINDLDAEGDWIFSVTPGNPISLPSSIKLSRASGVEVRTHDLRRSAGTFMTSSGTPRLTVSKVLNHSEAGITKIYDRHSYDPEKQQAWEAWAARLDEILTGRQVSDTAHRLQRAVS